MRAGFLLLLLLPILFLGSCNMASYYANKRIGHSEKAMEIRDIQMATELPEETMVKNESRITADSCTTGSHETFVPEQKMEPGNNQAPLTTRVPAKTSPPLITHNFPSDKKNTAIAIQLPGPPPLERNEWRHISFSILIATAIGIATGLITVSLLLGILAGLLTMSFLLLKYDGFVLINVILCIAIGVTAGFITGLFWVGLLVVAGILALETVIAILILLFSGWL